MIRFVLLRSTRAHTLGVWDCPADRGHRFKPKRAEASVDHTNLHADLLEIPFRLPAKWNRSRARSLRDLRSPKGNRSANSTAGVILSSRPIKSRCIPGTWFTSDTGDMVYTFSNHSLWPASTPAYDELLREIVLEDFEILKASVSTKFRQSTTCRSRFDHRPGGTRCEESDLVQLAYAN